MKKSENRPSETATLEDRVLQYVNRENYQPVKPKVIGKKLGLDRDGQKHLKAAIKRLVKSGKITYGQSHVVKKATSNSKSRGNVTGTFRRARGGFGFVRPVNVTSVSDKSNDIFIPANRTKDASNGDLVLVKLSARSGGPPGKTSGEIVEVVDRQTHEFVGLYQEELGIAAVKIDGGVFQKPVPVGDPGAKNAQPGDKVVIEMVKFPTNWNDGEGVIVDVLGARGDPGVDTLSIIREFNLPGDFPDDVMEDAREQAAQFDESTAGRTDLTELTIITIDPQDARDFDDAISLEKIENGHWRLGVHIADVSHFVPVGSALDAEGRNRATSVYLPDRVIPMLPEIISNNLASLQPEKVRYAKTVFIEFAPDGARISCEPHRAAIVSKRRFTYEEIDQFLANRKPWKKKLTPEVFDLLGRMHELAMMLRKRRFQNGSLELSMPEVDIDLDKDGKVVGAHLAENTESHQIIEEFMLAANEAVAEMFDDRELYFLRRIHSTPDEKKAREVTEFIRDLGIEVESLQDRFEIQRLLDRVKGEPFERAVNFAVLRSMQKAVYGPEEEGHYALAMRNYCHFTSPIRRYPDLTIHRLMDAIIDGDTPPNAYEPLVTLGQLCSDREQRAQAAERELIKVKLLHYFEDRIGETMLAVITGVQDFGLFAQGIDLPAEGLIHIRSLVDDYYHYDQTTQSLSGSRSGNQYRLGDTIKVEVGNVDIDRRELDLRLVGLVKHATTSASSKRSKRRASGKPKRTAKPIKHGKKKAKGKKKTKTTTKKRAKSKATKNKKRTGKKSSRRKKS